MLLKIFPREIIKNVIIFHFRVLNSLDIYIQSDIFLIPYFRYFKKNKNYWYPRKKNFWTYYFILSLNNSDILDHFSKKTKKRKKKKKNHRTSANRILIPVLSTPIRFLKCISNMILNHDHDPRKQIQRNARNSHTRVNLHICGREIGTGRNRIFWKPHLTTNFSKKKRRRMGGGATRLRTVRKPRLVTSYVHARRERNSYVSFEFRPIEFCATCSARHCIARSLP